jgi:serine/threonine protein phosphatase PrpC
MTPNPRDYLKSLAATCERLLEKKHGDITSCAGSTGLFVLLHDETIYSACIGDSRAVAVLRDGTALPLTKDQTPANSKERERIESKGGVVDKYCLDGDHCGPLRVLADSSMSN